MNPDTAIASIVTAIDRHRFLWSTEHDLQDGLAAALAQAGIELKREVIFSPQDRIDFMVGTIGIEVKVEGSMADVARQLMRYTPYVDGLVLVTTRSKHRLPASLSGKPVKVILLRSGF
jgi:hypothetical protein